MITRKRWQSTFSRLASILSKMDEVNIEDLHNGSVSTMIFEDTFWDGHSRDTEHMINFARRRRLDVTIISNGEKLCQEKHPLQYAPSDEEKRQNKDQSMNRGDVNHGDFRN